MKASTHESSSDAGPEACFPSSFPSSLPSPSAFFSSLLAARADARSRASARSASFPSHSPGVNPPQHRDHQLPGSLRLLRIRHGWIREQQERDLPPLPRRSDLGDPDQRAGRGKILQVRVHVVIRGRRVIVRSLRSGLQRSQLLRRLSLRSLRVIPRRLTREERTHSETRPPRRGKEPSFCTPMNVQT
jgi:hypothetical protein